MPRLLPGTLCSSLEDDSNSSRGLQVHRAVCPGDKKPLSHRTTIKPFLGLDAFPVQALALLLAPRPSLPTYQHVQLTPPLGPCLSLTSWPRSRLCACDQAH